MKTILILACNPREDIQTTIEIGNIQSAIERSIYAEEFNVVFKIGVRPKDLHEIFNKTKPYIVHFCGHGAGKEGLIFHGNESGEQLFSNKALWKLFNLFGKNTECALLNACNTEIQADVILSHVPYVIGTSGEIPDKAAYWFAVGFYTALGWGKSIEFCFKVGELVIASNLPHLDIEPDIEDNYRTGIVVLGRKSPNNVKRLKITLKKNSHLINPNLSANIPPDFFEAISKEKIRKNYKDCLRNVLNRFGQRTIEPNQVGSKFECEQRQTLLNKVEEFWIKGFLEPSLHFNPAINKNNKSLETISYPLDNLEVIPVNPDKSYDKLEQTDILNQIGEGKTLLILGEPGSGKTIALLQLAARLIKPTKHHKPIPVVFNLSSWGEKQQPLEEWLIEELKEKYQVPKALSEPWIKQQQLTLLLDGLDEVGNGLNDRIKAQELQNNCIIAINIFIAEHLETEIVVCSRVEDYEALTERLLLSSAICIQPFSKEQVLDTLKNVDDSLLGLRAAIEKYEPIAEFATTPLILNMMTWTYSHWSEERCHKEFQIRKDREFNLFESYIRNNLKREDIEEKYPKEKVKRWLSWLAKKMQQHSQTVFLIEKIQPTWISSKNQNLIYIFSSRIVGVIFWIMPFCTVRLVNPTDQPVLFPTILSGLLLGVNIGLIDRCFLNRKTKNKYTFQTNIYLILIVIISELIFGFIFIYSIEFPLGLIMGLSFGIFGGLLFGLRGLERDINNDIKTFEVLNWSWLNSLKWSIVALILTNIFVYLIIPLTGQYAKILRLVLNLIGVSLGITFGGLQNKISDNQLKTQPNQGIKYSFRSVILGSIIGFSIGILVGIIKGGNYMDSIETFATLGMATGGLRYGGIDIIQHFILRVILYSNIHNIPWNYARFLDYASERRLMKKVGGGYVFYHRMLMEHFAERYRK